MNKQMHGRMMNKWMDEQMDQCIDGWMADHPGQWKDPEACVISCI